LKGEKGSKGEKSCGGSIARYNGGEGFERGAKVSMTGRVERMLV
jgi:hypothetical protein